MGTVASKLCGGSSTESAAKEGHAATKQGGVVAAKASSKGLTLPVVRNEKHTMGSRSGTAAYLKAIRRYNITTEHFIGDKGKVLRRKKHHPGSGGDGGGTGAGAGTGTTPPAGGSGEETSEVPAESVQNDLEYVVEVKIGTPGVTLKLDFDTGSSDLWVWSSELRSSTTGHTIYNPKNSSSAKTVAGATWNISYGDGSSASGNVYNDAVSIGDVVIPSQAVELAEKLSQSFLTEGGSDGLLGLAWPALNTITPKAQATPVQNMIDQKLIPLPLFSVNLDRGDNNGFYTFGVIDSAKAGVTDADIKYTAVDNSQGFWMFPSTTATVAGKSIALSGNTAIADTGTTLALVSDSVVNALYAAIPGAKNDDQQGGWVFPADAAVPDLEVAVGDVLFKIGKEELAFSQAEGGMVFGGVQSRGSNPFDILGDVFLKSVYVVFDQGGTRIGVAQRST